MKRLQVLCLVLYLVVCGHSIPLVGQDAETSPVGQTEDNESKDSRLPVPSDATIKTTTKLVQDIYESDIQKAKTPKQKKALAKKLMADGIDTKDNPTGRFVLFQMARDLAAESGDIETAIEVIDHMGNSFDTNALEEQFKVVTKAVNKTLPIELRVAVVELGLKIIDRAVAEDKYKLANQVAIAILPAARKTKNFKLLKMLTERKKELSGMAEKYDFVKKALARLEKEPTNAKANQAVGEYRCYIKGNWSKGLPLLALGNNENWKALAVADLKGASSAAEQVRLGDGWWQLAEKSKGITKKHIQQRAAHWYKKVLPGLKGLAKIRVEKRLAGLAEQGPTVTIFLDDILEASAKVGFGKLGKHGMVGYASKNSGKVQGKEYPHALSMHPPAKGISYAAYQLDGKCLELNGAAAIWDNWPSKAIVTFNVIGDGKLLWKSRPLQGAGAGQSFRVSLRGVKALKLVVECPGNNTNATAVWLMPAITRPPKAPSRSVR